MDAEKDTTPLWEKIIGVVGGLLLIVGFIYLTWVAIFTEKTPPQVVFEVAEVSAVEEHFVVTLMVYNRSTQTLTDVQVEGALATEAVPVESHQMVLPYLPSHSRRTVAFLFNRNPAQGKLNFRAVGYQHP